MFSLEHDPNRPAQMLGSPLLFATTISNLLVQQHIQCTGYPTRKKGDAAVWITQRVLYISRYILPHVLVYIP